MDISLVGRIDASFFVVLAGSPTGRSSSQSVVPPQRKCPGTNAVAFFAWKTNRQIANMALGLRTLSVLQVFVHMSCLLVPSLLQLLAVLFTGLYVFSAA